MVGAHGQLLVFRLCWEMKADLYLFLETLQQHFVFVPILERAAFIVYLVN